MALPPLPAPAASKRPRKGHVVLVSEQPIYGRPHQVQSQSALLLETLFRSHWKATAVSASKRNHLDRPPLIEGNRGLAFLERETPRTEPERRRFVAMNFVKGAEFKKKYQDPTFAIVLAGDGVFPNGEIDVPTVQLVESVSDKWTEADWARLREAPTVLATSAAVAATLIANGVERARALPAMVPSAWSYPAVAFGGEDAPAQPEVLWVGPGDPGSVALASKAFPVMRTQVGDLQMRMVAPGVSPIASGIEVVDPEQDSDVGRMMRAASVVLVTDDNAAVVRGARAQGAEVLVVGDGAAADAAREFREGALIVPSGIQPAALGRLVGERVQALRDTARAADEPCPNIIDVVDELLFAIAEDQGLDLSTVSGRSATAYDDREAL